MVLRAVLDLPCSRNRIGGIECLHGLYVDDVSAADELYLEVAEVGLRHQNASHALRFPNRN